MNVQKTARVKDATYENIYFDCPHCHKENIINRASDLHTRTPVSGREIQCDACEQIVWLTGDRVTRADYIWFLNDLPKLKRQKRYREYILSLCQGLEMFFFQALINHKLDRNPHFRGVDGMVDLDLYNSISNAWKAAGFVLLRNLFEAEFKPYELEFRPASSYSLKDKRVPYFKEVYRTEINELRNKVVHSTAYRPTLSEIEEQDKLEDAIVWLGLYLDVTDSVSLLNRNLGRPKLEDVNPQKIELAKNLYRDRRKSHLSVEDICKQLGIGRTTLYRYIGEWSDA